MEAITTLIQTPLGLWRVQTYNFGFCQLALNKVFIINQTFVFLSLNRIIGIIILSNFFFLSLDRIITIIINQTFFFLSLDRII